MFVPTSACAVGAELPHVGVGCEDNSKTAKPLIKVIVSSYGVIKGFVADDIICCQKHQVLIESLLISSTGSNVKVSKSFKTCSYHIKLNECVAIRTLP